MAWPQVIAPSCVKSQSVRGVTTGEILSCLPGGHRAIASATGIGKNTVQTDLAQV